MSYSTRARTPSAGSYPYKSVSPTPSSSIKRRGSTNPRDDGQDQTPPLSLYHNPRIHLLDTCYICGNHFSSARQTINHVERIHGYSLPRRRQGYKRPRNKYIEYVRDRNGEWDCEELACPSCWFHYPVDDLLALNEHTREAHNPVKINPVKEGDDGYESAASAVSSASEASRRSYEYRKKRGSTPVVVVGNDNRRAPSVTPNWDEKTATEITARLDDLIRTFKRLFNS